MDFYIKGNLGTLGCVFSKYQNEKLNQCIKKMICIKKKMCIKILRVYI